MAYTDRLFNNVDKFGLIEKPVYGKLNLLITLLSNIISFMKEHTHTGNSDTTTDGTKITRDGITLSSFEANGYGLIPQGGIIIWDGVSCPDGFSESEDKSNDKWSLGNRYIRAILENHADINDIGGSDTHTHTTIHTHGLSTDTHNFVHDHQSPSYYTFWNGSTACSGARGDMGTSDHKHYISITVLDTTWSHTHTPSQTSTSSELVTGNNNVSYVNVIFCKKD